MLAAREADRGNPGSPVFDSADARSQEHDPHGRPNDGRRLATLLQCLNQGQRPSLRGEKLMVTIAELRDKARACVEAARDQAEPEFELRLKSRAIALAIRAVFEAEKERAKRPREPIVGG